VQHTVTLTRLSEFVVNADRGAPGEPNVRSTVLLGERYTIVFDTLYGPLDMTSVCTLVEERRRPLIVINSHADDDHVLGNGAFPMAPIVGHQQCRDRFLDPDDVAAQLRKRSRENPEEFGSVVLRAPDIAFTGSLVLDAGGFTVALHHVPGHKRDCIVAHVPEHGLLLGGDCVEDPLPLLEDGPLGAWSTALRTWAARPDVETVIPSHGPVSGPGLLIRNADYLDGLAGVRADTWQGGPGDSRFYVKAHTRNQARAAQLLQSE
jgi:glyoxylase-like metal-dependent hydrolase (beta-lactamase superfamily II)